MRGVQHDVGVRRQSLTNGDEGGSIAIEAGLGGARKTTADQLERRTNALLTRVENGVASPEQLERDQRRDRYARKPAQAPDLDQNGPRGSHQDRHEDLQVSVDV